MKKIGIALLMLVLCFSVAFSVKRYKKKKLHHGLSKFFKKVEFADTTTLLLGVKEVNIRGVVNPYNPSIIKSGDNNYLMAFRYDIPIENRTKEMPLFTTKLGVVELDDNFEQTEKDHVIIYTGSQYSEDPRLFVFKGDYYLIYNDRITPVGMKEYRTMHLAQIDRETFQPKWIKNLDQQIKPVEKNWVPIVHKDELGEEKFFLGYSINPHKILGMDQMKEFTELHHYIFANSPSFYDISWWKWGEPRGGTPPQKVNDEYLAFFHSFFKDLKNDIKYWYVMGAYTFEAKEPFRLTSLSKTPFLFTNIYSTPVTSKTVDPIKRVIYPSGYVQGVYKGRDVFFVSVGENDCAVKILIIDKEKLLKTLKKV